MGYNFLHHFVFSLKLELKLVLDDFALLPPENSQRIGKIYPWRTRLLYDPELLYCAKRVNRFYDEDTGKLLRIHMVICKRFCKSSTTSLRMFASNNWSDFCEILVNVYSISKIELRQDYNHQAICKYGLVGPRSLVTGKTRQILLYKSD